MSYASAVVRDGEVIGGMLFSPEHESHAPNLTPDVTAHLTEAIALLPKDGQVHVVEHYQPTHSLVRDGIVKAGIHINGVHMHEETHTETVTTLEPDAV